MATVTTGVAIPSLSPLSPLWHAVQLHRPVAEILGTCELTVCGSLVRITTVVSWPTVARDVCPACATLTR